MIREFTKEGKLLIKHNACRGTSLENKGGDRGKENRGIGRLAHQGVKVEGRHPKTKTAQKQKQN